MPCSISVMRRDCLGPLLAHLDVPIAAPRLEECGRRLTACLLPPPILNELIGTLARSNSPQSDTVRLRVAADDPSIAELPWEYAYLEAAAPLADRPGFLSLLPRTHLIRLSGRSEAQRALPVDTLKILVAWANPATPAYPTLPYGHKEAKSLISSLKNVPYRSRLDVRELANATLKSLKSAIEQFHPHILHFIGHGESGGYAPSLILEAETGHARLEYSELHAMIDYREFRLISLSACRSAALAQRLTQNGVPAAIAMQLPWSDAIAPQFSQTLFCGLTISAPLDEALAQARQSIRGAGPDWGNPVLFLCGGGPSLIEMSPAQAPHNLPFPRNPYFVGREDAIRELDYALDEIRSRPIAVVGMGGMGKTQLALEYAHRRLQEYPGGVFWIRASDEQQIRESFDSLGGLFNLPDGIENRPRRVFERIQSASVRTLIVFDNLNLTAASPEGWLPTGKFTRVLATTRDIDSVRGIYQRITLTDLDETSGVELLVARRSSVSDSERLAAMEIVRKTGGLPLAIELMAYYADRLDISYRECSDRLAESTLDTLELARKRFSNHTGHDGSLFDAIHLAYMRLSKLAKSVLNMACFFAPRGISREVLLEASGVSSERALLEALGDIAGYCLTTRDPNDRYNLHELIGEYVRFRMGARQRRRCAASVAGVLTRRLKAANSRMDWHAVRADMHHCSSSAALCLAEKLWEPLQSIRFETAVYWREHYDADGAARLFEAAHDAARLAFPEESIQEARALMGKAIATADLKEFTKAREYAYASLEMARRTVMEGGDELADFYNDLGYIIKKSGDPAQAIDVYQSADGLCANRGSALRASIRNNLGAAYEALHQDADAILSYREAMSIDIDRFGPEHPKVAVRLNNIGRLLAIAGSWPEALAMHEKALDIYRQTFGALHPDVASSHYYIGQVELGLEHLERAEVCFKEALDIYERFFGFLDWRTQIVISCIDKININKNAVSKGE